MMEFVFAQIYEDNSSGQQKYNVAGR